MHNYIASEYAMHVPGFLQVVMAVPSSVSVARCSTAQMSMLCRDCLWSLAFPSGLHYGTKCAPPMKPVPHVLPRCVGTCVRERCQGCGIVRVAKAALPWWLGAWWCPQHAPQHCLADAWVHVCRKRELHVRDAVFSCVLKHFRQRDVSERQHDGQWQLLPSYAMLVDASHELDKDGKEQHGHLQEWAMAALNRQRKSAPPPSPLRIAHLCSAA